MGRPQKGWLGGIVGWELGNDPACIHHQGPVAGKLDLWHLGREHQHSGAGGRKLPQDPIDLLLRADVDAARGVEA